jgi:hypothetical protein
VDILFENTQELARNPDVCNPNEAIYEWQLKNGTRRLPVLELSQKILSDRLCRNSRPGYPAQQTPQPGGNDLYHSLR